MAPALRGADTGTVDIERARWLVSPEGRAALDSLPPGLDSLTPTALADRLRRTWPAQSASALAEQVTLRAKASSRFGSDLGMIFTPSGLEMMTHPLVASRRAARLASLGRTVLDLTCGIGGDLRACACAEAGAATIGLEFDAATALIAAANVPAASVVRGDAARPPFDLAPHAVILDPARRSDAGRRFDPSAFTPPWEVCLAMLGEAAAGVLKAPPGIDYRYIPEAAETEFIQLGRSMREASVWMGAGATPGLHRAVMLPAGETITSADPEAEPGLRALSRYVFDPESCVTRAGLVRHLAARLGAGLMDSQVAYLTADAPAFDPLAATFEVIDSLPFSIARLRDHLRAKSLRPDEIRRRAFPIEPDELRKLLGKLEGDPVTVLMTTIASKRTIILARRVVPTADS